MRVTVGHKSGKTPGAFSIEKKGAYKTRSVNTIEPETLVILIFTF